MIRSFKLLDVLDHEVAICWLGLMQSEGTYHVGYAIALRTFHKGSERQATIWFGDKETALKLLREGDDVLRQRCQTFVEGLT